MKIKAVLIVVILLFALFTINVSGSAPQISLRIEGISENIYNGKLEYKENITVADVLMSVCKSQGISVEGFDTKYITSINGQSAGQFGGFDGWSYIVNGASPAVSMWDYKLKPNDEIVVFYGDTFGVGMQFPKADFSKLSQGIISFTSDDVIYDESFNATTVKNPVKDMKLIFDNTEYITDEKGSVQIKKEQLTVGHHSITVSKTNENGLPLVLRLAPDTTVNIHASTSDSVVPEQQNNSNNEESNFNPAPLIICTMLVLSGVAAVLNKKAKKNK